MATASPTPIRKGNGPEKRRSLRSRTTPFRVDIYGECQKIYGYVRDISCSGLQVRTFSLCSKVPKDVGDTFRLSMKLPDKDEVYDCSAKVVWSLQPQHGPRGMLIQGLQFVEIEPAVRSEIDEWAKAAATAQENSTRSYPA